MSMRAVIQTWLDDPTSGWSWHVPAVPGGAVKRHMLVSKHLRDAMDGPWRDAKEETRLSSLRGDLDAFVLGQRISIADDPYDKPKNTYMARVAPRESELWDIRSIDPRPSIRVLGCFAETDLFVALLWKFRLDLDGPNGPLWHDFVQRAEHAWRQFGMGLQPHSGSKISDYVSSNFFLV